MIFRRAALPCQRDKRLHEWHAMGVHQSTHYPGDKKEPDALPSHRSTAILYVCAACRHAKTERVDGHWSLEQVQGKRRIAEPEKQPWKGYVP